MIEGFVDSVSKNGNTLLNVGPRPDGTIPHEPAALLREVGNWLDTNAEAVYGSRPDWEAGEGPTEFTFHGVRGGFQHRLHCRGQAFTPGG